MAKASMNILCVILFTILLNNNIISQEDNVSLSTGIAFPTVYSKTFYGFDEYIDSTKQIKNQYISANYTIKISNTFGLKAGLGYDTRGWTEIGFVINAINGQITTDRELILQYEFLNLPIQLTSSYGNKVFVFSSLGPLFSYRIGGNIKGISENEIALIHFAPTFLAPKVDFSLMLGLGVGFKFTENVRMYVEGEVIHGFTHIGIKAPIEREIKHKVKRIGFGIQYKLKRNVSMR